MFLKEIEIANFRNIINLKIEFNQNIIYFIGDNAQGKTNILEALYHLCLLKSFRAKSDKELILFNENFFSIKGKFIDENKIERKVLINYSKTNRKEIVIDNKKVKRYSDYIGIFPAVIFSTHDFEIISGPPSFRRKILNIIISQCSKNYLYHLKQYDHIIKQRNKILAEIYKSKNFNNNELESWNEQLIKHSEVIINYRKQYIDELNNIIEDNYKKINSQYPINIKYIPNFSVSDNEDFRSSFRKKLNKIFLQELKSNFTLCGPHRDDFAFFLGNKDCKLYGSRGEQKIVLIFFKAAECELIIKKLAKSPLIILDDIFSEFDKKRSQMIMELFYLKGQCFISGTDLIETKYYKDGQIFFVTNGRINQ